mmetsp:Transcript_12495/g.29816  ORF Transcript_12495/g.29816 Transcript_12495/m.29816 type:complete len:314 (+) Transcript_12495:68-1009(+)
MKSFTLLSAILLLADFNSVTSFSTPSSSSSGGAGFLKLDRFSPSCPADESCIRQFDPKLIDNTTDGSQNGIWVAVYRSNNNMPSVFVRDEFFSAMSEATSSNKDNNDSSSNQQQQDQVDSSKISTPMALEKPVAVARLIPSTDFDNKWVLDSMRCLLKKEDQDETCDGGSEFVEALSVCVDSLLLHHLKENTITKSNNNASFEGSIRTKATLYSHKILQDRGFCPVEELSKDMATHISQYNACLESYAMRTASTNLNPGARDRALQMVSLLGKLDEEVERQARDDNSNSNSAASDADDDQDDYDPWANVKMQI